MRPKIRCDGESTVLLQNFLDLNWAQVENSKWILRRSNGAFFGGSRTPFRTAGIAESLKLAATLPTTSHDIQLTIAATLPTTSHDNRGDASNHKSRHTTDKSLIKYDLEEKKDMNKTLTKENFAKSNPNPHLLKKILLQYLP
jgi:hypothetical protein